MPLAPNRLTEAMLPIRAFVMDMDGVVTNGQVLCMEPDGIIRNLNNKDAFALQLATRLGYHVAIISGGRSPAMTARFRALGIREIFMEVPYKLPVFVDYVSAAGLQYHEVIYIGDDLPDIEVMELAGLAVAPADAATDILGMADWITAADGGRGAIREAIEAVLKAQERWIRPDILVW